MLICQKGELGLILWQKECIYKRIKTKYTLYHGINLSKGKIGLNWQSKDPKFITKSKFKKIFEGIKKWECLTESRLKTK